MKSSGLLIFMIAFGVLLTLVSVPFFIGSYTLADSIRGFEILEQYKQGADFNTLNYTSVNEPLIRYSVSWWAPGQWLLPLAIQFLGISNYQHIQAISILLLLLLSFWAYWRLFRALGIESWIRSLSMLILVTSPLFYWQSLMFHGSDLLLLAFLPWFFLLLLRVKKKRTIWSYTSLILLGIIGVYLKTSFLILFAGGTLFLFFGGQHTLKERIKSNYFYFIAALAVLIFTKTILLQGETPGSAVDHEGWFGVPNTISGDLLHAFASPLGSISNLSSIIQAQSALHGVSILQVLGLAVLAVLSFWILIRVLLRNEDYGKLLLFVGYSFFVVMTVLYLSDRAVSYEMRHFAPLSFLFVPAILDTIQTFLGKTILLIISALLLFFNVHNYWFQASYLAEQATVNGIKLSQEDTELANFIQRWDSNQSSSLCLVENVWSHSFFVRNNDKLVLKGLEPQIVSGMELDSTTYLDDLAETSTLFDSYNEVLLITYENNETNLKSLLTGKHEISSGQIGRYSWYRLK